MNKGANTNYHKQKNAGYRVCFEEIPRKKYVPNEKIVKMAMKTLDRRMDPDKVVYINIEILKTALKDYYIKQDRWHYLDKVMNCLKTGAVYESISDSLADQLALDRELALSEWRASEEGNQFYQNGSHAKD